MRESLSRLLALEDRRLLPRASEGRSSQDIRILEHPALRTVVRLTIVIRHPYPVCYARSLLSFHYHADSKHEQAHFYQTTPSRNNRNDAKHQYEV